jgi:hypothetical protein
VIAWEPRSTSVMALAAYSDIGRPIVYAKSVHVKFCYCWQKSIFRHLLNGVALNIAVYVYG